MSARGLESFDHTVQLTYIWLKELSEGMRWERQRQRSYHLLRAVLHTLRDCLPFQEAVDLGAQLPMLVRGFYYEGWRPNEVPIRPRDKATFLAHVDAKFVADPLEDTEHAVSQTLALIARHVSEGEIEDVRRCLPADIRKLWP